MARVGVFGGSFNPIHEGHVSFLEQIKINLNLDEILLVVCKNAFHKSVNLVDKTHRFEMCRQATKHLNYVKVSDLEFEIDKGGYSIYTLSKIKQQKPNSELFLIVGLDSFLKIHTWHKFEDILELATIVSGYSSDEELAKMNEILTAYKFKALLFRVSLMNCHSTMIRIRLAQGLSCRLFLNSEVYDYIECNKLYCFKNALFLECENACKNMVSPKRFNHCLMVANEAVNLAKIYGENEEYAQIAGVLHDIVKEQSSVDLLRILKIGGVSFDDLTEVDKVNFKLWHGPAGAIYCKFILGLEIDEILKAIDCHTTGKANMTNFEKIIYTADNISADRKGVNVRIERKLAYKNLNRALLFHLKTYIKLGFKKNLLIHLNSINCFNDLILKGEV